MDARSAFHRRELIDGFTGGAELRLVFGRRQGGSFSYRRVRNCGRNIAGGAGDMKARFCESFKRVFKESLSVGFKRNKAAGIECKKIFFRLCRRRQPPVRVPVLRPGIGKVQKDAGQRPLSEGRNRVVDKTVDIANI